MYPQADFERMCGNALTYNGPDTAYYGLAKTLLSNGLQIIAKVRPSDLTLCITVSLAVYHIAGIG